MAPILGPPAARPSSRAAPSRSGRRARPAACVQLLLAAGLRLEPFPILMCWDEPVTDYTRYLPISPGLL